MINEDKDLIDLLGDIEVNLDEYETQELTDIEKMKLKKNFREKTKTKNNNYKKYASVASIALISLAILSQTKIGAYASSALEDISDTIKMALGVDEKVGAYSSNINQSITKHGLTIKIEDVILDGEELIIHMSNEYTKKLEKDEYIDITPQYVYINGEKINSALKIYDYNDNNQKKDFVLTYDLPKEYEGNIDVKLRTICAYKYNHSDIDYHKTIIGPWTFKFSTNGDKLNEDTKDISLNKKIQLQTGSTITLENYRGNLISQKIKLSMTGHKNISSYKNPAEIILRGRDNLGNKVEFEPILGFLDTKDQKYIYEYDDRLKPFDEKAETLYLTPYLLSVDNNGEDFKRIYKKIGDEFKIELNK